MLLETAMPVALVKTEFITHPDQAVFLSAVDNQRMIAQMITEGICRL